MKNYIEEGNRMNYTAGADIASGAGVLVGTKLGVACTSIANGTTGVLAMSGVYELAKLSTDNMTQGAALYWDNTNSRLTITASGNTLAGYAFAAAAASTTTVKIKLNS